MQTVLAQQSKKLWEGGGGSHIVRPSLNRVFLQLNKAKAYLGTISCHVPVPKSRCSFLISFVIGVILQEATHLIGSQVRWNKGDGWLTLSLLLFGDANEAAVEQRKKIN